MSPQTWQRLSYTALICASLFGAAGYVVPLADCAGRAARARLLAPVVVPVAPRPGAVLSVDSTLAYVAARVVGHRPLARVVLWLDGTEVTPAVLGPDDHRLSLFYRPRQWQAGRHTVRLHAWDQAGAVGQAGWSFWISPAP